MLCLIYTRGCNNEITAVVDTSEWDSESNKSPPFWYKNSYNRKWYEWIMLFWNEINAQWSLTNKQSITKFRLLYEIQLQLQWRLTNKQSISTFKLLHEIQLQSSPQMQWFTVASEVNGSVPSNGKRGLTWQHSKPQMSNRLWMFWVTTTFHKFLLLAFNTIAITLRGITLIFVNIIKVTTNAKVVTQ
jgi:hypothetical protein